MCAVKPDYDCLTPTLHKERLMKTPVKTKQDILNVLRENRTRIRALGVRRIGVFGSFVRGVQRSDSDIDLLVRVK